MKHLIPRSALILCAALGLVPSEGLAQTGPSAGVLSGPLIGREMGQGAAQTGTLPLWEIGLGAIGRMATEYPGADSYKATLRPIPHIKYRGKFLELGGDDALRIVPFRTERFEFGLSFDSSSRVVNRVTPLGNVLPDLGALLEAGPELIFRLADQPLVFGHELPGRIEALLQIRGVFSFDDDLAWEGTLYRPALRYRQYGMFGTGSRIQASIGPIFTTQGLQDAYYGVDDSDNEPGYDASSGYLGTELRSSMRYPVTPRVQVTGGLAVTYLGGGVNHDSPLVKSDWDGAIFLGITYSLFQSRQRTLRDR